jgi:hypothetical protein
LVFPVLLRGTKNFGTGIQGRLQSREEKMISMAQTLVVRAFLLILAGQIATFSPVPALASQAGWVLTQRSKDYGDQYVYLSSSGVKCVNPRQGFGLVTKAPSWDVSFYNDKTKLYYSLTFSSWKRKLQARRKPLANLSWHKSQPGRIAGLRATKFTMTNPGSQQGSTGVKWLSADCWVADDIKVPPQLAEMLATTYGLPSTRSVPLRVTYKDINGRSETILDTYQQQSAPVPDSYLTAPQGYRLAKSEMEVMMTDENKQLVDDIARDLGKEPPSYAPNESSVKPSPLAGPGGSINIPSNGVTLPNGQSISKDEINKYIDAYKQYRQNGR